MPVARSASADRSSERPADGPGASSSERPADRRALIAAAAVRLLAAEGARGLTHRGVDRLLDLPAGSTSYYMRTRRDLLTAAVDHVVDADRQDVEEVARLVGADPAAGPVAAATELVRRWAAPGRRELLAARFELLLDMAREGADHPLAVARQEFLTRTARALGGDGVHAERALGVVAVVEGVLLNALIGGDPGDDVRADLLQRALTALASST